ncbi:MAG: hypothetical protein Q4F12_01705 [Erysipelotrichaceae bacterium]|nr:hypothetical protein [Erysipelotrichaceae bacterium]
MKKFKKLILPIICILLFLGACYLYLCKKNLDNQIYARKYKLSEEYNSILKDLRNEKNNLKEALELVKEEKEELTGRGSTMVLISNEDKEIVDEVEKLLDKYKYKGVIAINDEYFPSDNIEGALNKEDIEHLLEKDYELALVVNGFSDVVSLYNKYQNDGLDIKAFYFPNNDINSTQIRDIKSLGMDFIINYSTDEYDTLVPIVTIGSYEKNASKLYENNVNESNIIALVIGNSNESEQYSYDNVDTMLKVVKNYIKKDMTDIANFTDAKVRYDEYQEELYSAIESDSLEKIENLENRLEELKKQLGN